MKDALAGVASFVREHYIESTVWPEGDLENWLKFAASMGYLMIALDDKQKPVGLVIARTVNDIPARKDMEPFDENGKIIYIDFAIAPNKKILKALGWAVLQRYGKRELIVYRNNGHSTDEDPEDIRVHLSNDIAQGLLKLRN